jgi:lipoate---protein ligase
VNASIEFFLFKSLKEENPILFIWRNDKSIFIGRHQNPWMECNLAVLRNKNVPIIRRESGGGTVYHDLGNLNFCFMTSNGRFNKERNFEIVIKALRSLGVESEFSGRNDLLWSGKKISGSAFRHEKQKSYHHGTLLVDADLTSLAEYLSGTKFGKNSKGISSVVSQVINVKQIQKKINFDSIILALEDQYKVHMKTSVDKQYFNHQDKLFLEESRYHQDKLKQWDWLYGKTPEFNLYLDRLKTEIKVKSGIIQSIVGNIEPAFQSEIEPLLKNCRLEEKDFTELCNNVRQQRFSQLLIEAEKILKKEFW